MSVNRRALTRGFSAIQTQLSVEAHVCEQQVRILYLSFSEHVHAYVRGELLSGSLSSPCRFIQARLTRSMRAMTGAGATICSDDSLLASSGAPCEEHPAPRHWELTVAHSLSTGGAFATSSALQDGCDVAVPVDAVDELESVHGLRC